METLAGEALDTAVAVQVMGLTPQVDFGEWPEHVWHRAADGNIDAWVLDNSTHNGPGCDRCYYSYCENCEDAPTEPCRVSPPQYSTGIYQAWQVIEKMETLGFFPTIRKYLPARETIQIPQVMWEVRFEHDDLDFSLSGDGTVAETICQAALEAIDALAMLREGEDDKTPSEGQ